MASKINLIIGGVLILLVALVTWYVQGLRADNARLTTELTQALALAEDNKKYIEQLQAISAKQQEIQEATQQKITSLNSQIAKIRREGTVNNASKDDIEARVAIAVADKLNSLRRPAGSNS